MPTLLSIRVLGALAFLAFIAQAVLSWLLSASLTYKANAVGSGEGPTWGANQRQYLIEIANALPWLPEWFSAGLRGEGLFRSDAFFFAAYYTPLMIQTVCFAVALMLVLRARSDEMNEIASRVYWWSIAFSITTPLAYSTLTQDIWLSVVWGKMGLAGVDPFTTDFDGNFTAGLPLDYPPINMTYGPLWLLVSMAVIYVAGSSAFLAFFLLKLVLLASWILCLQFTRDIALQKGARTAATAILILGWLPVAVHACVAEGHNDVVMMALALLWLKQLHSTSFLGPLALACSVGIKYVTAPLAVVDLVYQVRTSHWSLGSLVRQYFPATMLAACLFIFLVVGHRYAEAGEMAAWRYLAPTDILTLIENAVGLDTGRAVKAYLAVLGFGALAAWRLWQMWKEPSFENVMVAQLAIMCAVLFGVVGHSWPWFFVWLLPFAALAPRNWLSVFVIAAAMVSPLTIAHWWRWHITSVTAPFEHHLLPSLVMFGFAGAASIAWLLLQRSQAVR